MTFLFINGFGVGIRNHGQFLCIPKSTNKASYKILCDLPVFRNLPIAESSQVADRSEQLRGETDQLAQEMEVGSGNISKSPVFDVPKTHPGAGLGC